MHAIVFADWALEAENAHVTSESAIFIGSLNEKKDEPNEQRSDRNRQSDEHSCFDLRSGVQKLGFLMQNGVGRSSKMSILP